MPDILSATLLQREIGDDIKEIFTDETKAQRVFSCLRQCKTKGLIRSIRLAFKCGEDIKHTLIFKYLKKAIDNKNSDISYNFADPDVLSFRDMVSRLAFEVHRFKGFIRFSESNGFYYAHYEPDNDITELLMPHFKQRFKNQRFVIHDVRRNVLGLYDGKKSKTVNAGLNKIEVYLSESERNFTDLWKTYYDSVNIKERKNERQMRAYMPVRYWKNLPEKEGFKK